MKHIELAADAAVAAKAAAGVAGVGTVLTWDLSVAIVGVPVSVLFAALLGSSLGVAYGDPISSRQRQIIVAIVNAFIGSAVGAMLPHLPGLGFFGKVPGAAVAILLGFFARWAVPALVERLPALISGKLGNKIGGDEL